MKRHESRNISRSRKMVQALNPCEIYSKNRGFNPFAYLFQKLQMKALNEVKTDEEKKAQHQLKMKADQKSAKARQNRKRNKV
jgi:hypothetical protein